MPPVADAARLVQRLGPLVEAQSRALAGGDGGLFQEAGEEISAILAQLAQNPPQDPEGIGELRAIRLRLAADEESLRRVVQEHGLQLQALLRAIRTESRVIDRLV